MKTESPISSRDRYLLTFSHQEADRIPIDLCTGEGYRFPGEPWRRGPLDRVRAVGNLGGDPCLDLWLPEPSFHPDVRVHRGTRTSGHDRLIFAEYETPAGSLTQVVRETADWRDERQHQLMQLRNLGDSVREEWGVQLFDDWNAARYERSPVQTIQDVDKLRYLLRIPDGRDLERWRAETRRVKQWAETENLLLRARRTFGAEAGMWLMRFEEFLLATLENPDLVEALVDVVADWQLKRAELALDIGVDVLMHRGYYETPDYFSPNSYSRFCRPLIDRLGTMARESGTRFALQRSEGNTRHVDVLHSMPIDILFDVEPGIGGEDLHVLKNTVGKKMTLWGGVDSTTVMNFGSPHDIDAAIRQAVEVCARSGGFVIMPITWIQDGVPFDHVRHAVSACLKYGAT